MARAIDADKLLDKVHKDICRTGCVISAMFDRRYKKLIEEAPTIEPKQEWVSVKDRLPGGEYGSVLIYTKNGGVAEGQYRRIDDEWLQFRWSVRNAEVTHWMPLPEPPETE